MTAPTPDLRFPIGKFAFPTAVTRDQRNQWIQEIADTPSRLRAAIAGLNAAQMETPYRPGGWTVRQVVHHVPESHMNAYIRFKLALTEDEPTIKPYNEAEWAKTPDVATVPVETSLAILEPLHERWIALLRGLSEADFARTFRHPEMGLIRVEGNIALYAWHGRHHTAHITSLRERMGW
jgi:hypothetical protein